MTNRPLTLLVHFFTFLVCFFLDSFVKTIGIIGGMSWQSTALYYQLINKLVSQHMGGNHSAKLVINSLNFDEIALLQHQDNWAVLTDIMRDSAVKLQHAGADYLLIATNTMHKMADEVQSAINVPLLHIADAVAKQIKANGWQKVGLLGTAFTMEQPFYKDYLKTQHCIDVVVPSSQERIMVHQVIFDELVKGKVQPASKVAYLEVMQGLRGEGAQAIILGCTEIPLLVNQSDINIPLIDSLHAHCVHAVDKSIN